MGDIRTVTVKIEGRVQGVFFRAWTEQTARSLGLDGTVCNMGDGSVEAVFSGPAEIVADMLRRCADGPRRRARDQGDGGAGRRRGRAGLQGDQDEVALRVA